MSFPVLSPRGAVAYKYFVAQEPAKVHPLDRAPEQIPVSAHSARAVPTLGLNFE